MTTGERKDIYSRDSRKTFIILIFCLALQFLQDFFLFFSSAVFVDFINTMKTS